MCMHWAVHGSTMHTQNEKLPKAFPSPFCVSCQQKSSCITGGRRSSAQEMLHVGHQIQLRNDSQPHIPPCKHPYFTSKQHTQMLQVLVSCLCLSHCFGACAAAQHSMQCSAPRGWAFCRAQFSVHLPTQGCALSAHLLQDQRLDTGSGMSSELHFRDCMWSRCIL